MIHLNTNQCTLLAVVFGVLAYFFAFGFFVWAIEAKRIYLVIAIASGAIALLAGLGALA